MELLVAALGALAVVTGALPWADTVAVTERVAPVLAFLVAVTVLAELADAAEVFDVAATRIAALARGHTFGLFLLLAGFATAVTVGLSLDTTAVLLTPVVIVLAQRLGLSPLPFAFLTVWLANVASLLLPISNLTNLLALDRLHWSASAFGARMWLPELVVTLGTVGLLAARFRADLRGRYGVEPLHRAADRPLYLLGVLACLAIVPGAVAGLQPWVVAVPAAGVLAAGFAVRRRKELRFALLPWRLVLFTEGLFLLVSAAGVHGLDAALRALAGHSPARTAAVGAIASNAVNNLPSYLAVERAVPAHAASQLLALLIGVNCGPLITPWGSLATLLWRARCSARGVAVPLREFVLLGLVGVPALVAAATVALLA